MGGSEHKFKAGDKVVVDTDELREVGIVIGYNSDNIRVYVEYNGEAEEHTESSLTLAPHDPKHEIAASVVSELTYTSRCTSCEQCSYGHFIGDYRTCGTSDASSYTELNAIYALVYDALERYDSMNG